MFNDVLKTKWLRLTLMTLVTLIVLLAAFWFGMMVGERRADFRNEWGENYSRFFGEPRSGFFGELPGGGPMNPYGNAGTVLSVQGNVIVAKGIDNNEKTIVVGSSTIIREQANTLSISDIKPGDSIVAIGEPNTSGQVEANFIRVFPKQ